MKTYTMVCQLRRVVDRYVCERYNTNVKEGYIS